MAESAGVAPETEYREGVLGSAHPGTATLPPQRAGIEKEEAA